MTTPTITYTPSQDLKDKFEKVLDTIATQGFPSGYKEMCFQYVMTLVTNDTNSFIQQQNLIRKRDIIDDDDRPRKIILLPPNPNFSTNSRLIHSNSPYKRGKWKTTDETMLIESVDAQLETSQDINWAEIKKKFPERTEKNCRNHYGALMIRKINK
jgi:hypothetical protein